MEKITFKVKYNHGLMNDSVVEATNEEEAKKEALALYRKNCQFVSFQPIDFVVKSVTPIIQ